MVAFALALSLVLAACAPDEPEAMIEGLDMSAAIQVGHSFEMTLPVQQGTTVELVSVPDGVAATVGASNDGQTVSIGLDVAPDAAIGSYELLLRAKQGPTEAELEWPFDVVPVADGSTDDNLDGAGQLRLDIVNALAASDEETLMNLLPETAWESFGRDLVASFAAGSLPTCEQLSETRAWCLVFENEGSRVLELTMDHDDRGWNVTSASLESTN